MITHLVVFFLLIGLFFLTIPFSSANSQSTLTDLSSLHSFYKPYIHTLNQKGILTGYLKSGEATGLFKPERSLSRSELTKLITSTRLLEENQSLDHWKELSSALALQNEIQKSLTPYYKCNAFTCSTIGGKEFQDVPSVETKCSLTPEGPPCDPWFTPYVYYSVNEGYIKGYESDGHSNTHSSSPLNSNRVFKPKDPIKRIHALKMFLVNSGNVPSAQDSRFLSLKSLALNSRSAEPYCLKGSEDTLFQSNLSKNTTKHTSAHFQDAHHLMEYALLADQLQFFGKDCAFFKENGAFNPEEKVNLLHEPLKRKEAARFLMLSSLNERFNEDLITIDPLDPELELNASASSNHYRSPSLVSLKEKAEEGFKIPSDQSPNLNDQNPNPNIPNSPKTPTNPNSPNNPTSPKIPTSDGNSKPKISTPNPIEQKALKSETGRCCQGTYTVPEHLCKTISFKDYSFNEKPEDFQLHHRQLWYKATQKADPFESCYVPNGDILNGYTPPVKKESKSSYKKQESSPNPLLDLQKNFISSLKDVTSNAGEAARILINLENYALTHTLDQTKDYGLGTFNSDPSSRKQPGTWQYDLVSYWHLLRSRQEVIYKNLNEHLIESNNLEKTRFWGLEGKRQGTLDHYLVSLWYEMKKEIDIEENMYEFTQTASDLYTVSSESALELKNELKNYNQQTDFLGSVKSFSKIMYQSMAYKIKVDYYFVKSTIETAFFELPIKEFGFKIYNNTASRYQSNNQNTYLIFHGFGRHSSIGTDSAGNKRWGEDMADRILENDPNAQILLLDWWYFTVHLNNYAEAKKIKWLSNILALKLHEWGINPDKTIIIGDSMGGLLGGVVSKSIQPENGVKKLVVLEPRSKIIFDYKIDSNTYFDGFKNKAQYTLCITGSFSNYGSMELLDGCDEAFLIDFPLEFGLPHSGDLKEGYTSAGVKKVSGKLTRKLVGFVANIVVSTFFSSMKEHDGVNRIYRDLLFQNTMFNRLLSPYPVNKSGLPTHDKITILDDAFGTTQIDGTLILTESPATIFSADDFKLQYLEMVRGDTDIYMGTEVENSFYCRSIHCEFYGWRGDDKFTQDKFDNSFTVKDFKATGNNDDRLYLKSSFFENQVEFTKQNFTENGSLIRLKYLERYDGSYYKSEMFLEGISSNVTKEWIDLASGSGKYANYTEEELLIEQKDNPIIID